MSEAKPGEPVIDVLRRFVAKPDKTAPVNKNLEPTRMAYEAAFKAYSREELTARKDEITSGIEQLVAELNSGVMEDLIVIDSSDDEDHEHEEV